MIPYGPIRTWLSFVTPLFFILVVARLLGITEVKPEFELLRNVVDTVVTLAFGGGVACAIYTVVHNARRKMKGGA